MNCWLRYNKEGAAEILVQRKDLPTCDNSWELVDCVLQLFPDLHLEENVKDLWGVLIRDQSLGKMYFRKGPVRGLRQRSDDAHCNTSNRL